MDTATLRRALARDVDRNFEAVVLEFQSPLFAFAFGMSGCRQDAEEIVQDSLVRAYRALKGYDAERIAALSLQAWLYRICLNLIRNRARRHRPVTMEFDEKRDDRRAEDDPVSNAYERREVAESIRGYLAGLPDRYRSAVALRYIADLSYQEIARTLNQPEGTVKSNVHRGLAELAATMTASGMKGVDAG